MNINIQLNWIADCWFYFILFLIFKCVCLTDNNEFYFVRRKQIKKLIDLKIINNLAAKYIKAVFANCNLYVNYFYYELWPKKKL